MDPRFDRLRCLVSEALDAVDEIMFPYRGSPLPVVLVVWSILKLAIGLWLICHGVFSQDARTSMYSVAVILGGISSIATSIFDLSPSLRPYSWNVYFLGLGAVLGAILSVAMG